MGFVKDLWDDVTGKTAQREAEEAAERDRLAAENRAASARVFAETEGQGRGSAGQVSLGLEDEELDTKIKKQSNMYL